MGTGCPVERERNVNLSFKRTTATAGAAVAMALILSACGAANEEDSGTGDEGTSALAGTLNGAGASSQEAAVAAWSQGFQTANPEVTVNYDPVGSGGGREQFLAGGTSFAGTDSILSDDELATAAERCVDGLVEIPTYVSPIAVLFNIEGVSELSLSPAVIGEIFSGAITNWNDPKIAAENEGAELPDLDITPVHRADESGTTGNFTDYLDAASGGTWDKGSVEVWPFESGEGAEGTSGVVAAVAGGNGTIGYADASQAGDLGVAKIKVGDEFVAYSPAAAAKALDVSTPIEGRGDNSIVFDLDRKTKASGAYPLILVSYQIACTTYEDENEAKLVKGWLSHITSDEGQQASADGAGSAPISAELTSQIAQIVDAIAAAS